MSIWIVRGLAWYPRKTWNPEEKPKLITVKRPNKYAKARGEWKEAANGLGCIGIPVEAETKETAVEIALESGWFEEVQGPVTRYPVVTR